MKKFKSIAYTLIALMLFSCGAGGGKKTPHTQDDSTQVEDGMEMTVAAPISSAFEVIDADRYSALQSDFNQNYVNPNSGLYFDTLGLDWDTLSKYIDYATLSGSTNEGLGLFYGLVGTDMVYFLARAKKTNIAGRDTIVVDSIGGMVYILQLSSGAPGFTLSDATQLAAAMNNYDNQVQVDINGTNHAVNTLNHPGVCYHEGQKLEEFKNHNPSHSRLIVGNIVTPHTGVMPSDLGLEVQVQTPLLIFGHQGQLMIDNVVHPQRFVNKGMDLGGICPPNCH